MRHQPRRILTSARIWRLVGCLAISWSLAAGLRADAAATTLLDAVRRGDVEAVRVQIASGAAVRTPDVDGTTALHWAAYRNDLAVARLLLNAGADATVANRYGVRPLSLACLNGNAAMVVRLLEAGADPNGARATGETPLMTASRTGALPEIGRAHV